MAKNAEEILKSVKVELDTIKEKCAAALSCINPVYPAQVFDAYDYMPTQGAAAVEAACDDAIGWFVEMDREDLVQTAIDYLNEANNLVAETNEKIQAEINRLEEEYPIPED